MSSWKPDIFEYLSYRDYLKAYYEAAKANNNAFSYRYFSRRAGYSSPNFLKLVMDGQRNLSNDSIDRFAKALKLTGAEHRFFRALVHFDQADTAAKKNQAFEDVAASRRFRKARRLDRAYFDYLSRWYYPAIREMVARADFVEDPDWIAGQLLPPLKAPQVIECLEVLLELGLLQRDEEGRLHRGEASVTTGHEVRSLAIGNYHRQMMQRASESIELVHRNHRDISALTVCISPERIAEFKERIHAFRETLLDLGDRDDSPTCVYQLNLQFFPLNEVPADPDDEA